MIKGFIKLHGAYSLEVWVHYPDIVEIHIKQQSDELQVTCIEYRHRGQSTVQESPEEIFELIKDARQKSLQTVRGSS